MVGAGGAGGAGGLLTVPWSYFVLNAAYNRDVLENARSLARRVETQHAATYGSGPLPMDFLFPYRDALRKRQMSDALKAEISSEPSVQTLVFYSISYVKPEGAARVTRSRCSSGCWRFCGMTNRWCRS